MKAMDRFSKGTEVRLMKGAPHTRKKGWQSHTTIKEFTKRKILIIDVFHSAVDEAVRLLDPSSGNTGYFHFMDLLLPEKLEKKEKPQIVHFDTSFLNL